MRQIAPSLLLIASFLLLLAARAGQAAAPDPGAEWARFRGPNGTGISEAKSIPTALAASDIVWRTKLPGEGHSSPIGWAGQLFLTVSNPAGGQRWLVAVDAATGKENWRSEARSGKHATHKFNHFAASSPAADDQRVYAVWADGAALELVATTHAGKPAWSKPVGASVAQHGPTVSPIVFQDMVIVANDHDATGAVTAFDAATGAVRWSTPRKAGKASYSTPCVFFPQDGGKPQLIVHSEAQGVTALDLATGKEAWSVADAFNKRTVSACLTGAGLVFGTCGEGGGGSLCVAIRPGAGSAKPAEAFHLKTKVPYVPTGLVDRDHLYLWADGGIVSCVHLPDGELRWSERIEKASFFGSPVLAGGHMYALSKEGLCVVVKASPDKFELVSSLPLGEMSYATPAILGGKMYLRTLTQLFCVGPRKSS